MIVCPITSQNRTGNKYAIELHTHDIVSGSLKHSPSYVSTDILFTADSRLISYKAGELAAEKMNEVTETLVKILQQKF